MSHKIGTINLMNGKNKTMYAGPNGGIHTKGANGNKTPITKKVARSMGVGMQKLKNFIKSKF